MTKTTTIIWDPATYLATSDDVAAYLEAALQDGDPQLVAAALGDIARAKGMSQVARDAGLGRESLCKSLSSSGNPDLATVLKVISVLGLELHVTAVDEAKMAVHYQDTEDGSGDGLSSRSVSPASDLGRSSSLDTDFAILQ
jgi:probable addiction module antidote protein